VTAPAPADLGIEVLHVPEGSPVEFEIRLEAVMEGVLVTGTATAGLTGECVRCLEEIRDDVTVDFQELFVYEESDTAATEEDGATSRLVGDLLDLEPLLRDAVVLSLPFQPRLADDPGHQHEEAIDPRWVALRGLTDDDVPSREPGRVEE
jgi:uncharacterized protein